MVASRPLIGYVDSFVSFRNVDKAKTVTLMDPSEIEDIIDLFYSMWLNFPLC